MKALHAIAAALLCGAAGAQSVPVQDGGALCRSFCDADANQCRREASSDASGEVDPLLDFRGPRADKDDFSLQKHDQAVRSADRDRLGQSRRCGETRMACRQKCGGQAASVAASAPR